MKKIRTAIAAIAILLLQQAAFAQGTGFRVTDKQETVGLVLSYYKTTNLIFPFAIKSVDKGSRDVLVQKAGGVENVLQVKAGKQNFPQTNLTVITADGQLYSFLLDYGLQPGNLNIRLNNARKGEPEVQFTSADDNEALVKGAAETIAAKMPAISGLKARNADAILQLTGLYIKDDLYYFQFQLENRSAINYDVDQFRFFIRDQAIAKRTANQELELKPQQVYGNHQVIRSRSKQTVVFAIPKFTIQENKDLVIQLSESRGSRNLTLRLKNKHLVKASAF